MLVLFFFIDKGWLLKPLFHKTSCGQPLSKFGMFTFVVPYTVSLCFFLKWRSKQDFLDFWWEKTKEGSNFQRGGECEPPLDETMVQK